MANYSLPEWASLPSKWIMDGELHEWGARDRGTKMAAMKLFLAIALRAGNSKKQPNGYGVAQLTYDDFEMLTDLSRSMISRGLRFLRDKGLITVHERGRKRIYELRNFNVAGHWRKLPKRKLYGTSMTGAVDVLHGLSTRRRSDFNALRLYLVLLTFRDRKTNEAKISYDRIEDYLGIQRSHIRQAISVLIEHSLVYVTSEHDETLNINHPNRYYINGLQVGT